MPHERPRPTSQDTSSEGARRAVTRWLLTTGLALAATILLTGGGFPELLLAAPAALGTLVCAVVTLRRARGHEDARSARVAASVAAGAAVVLGLGSLTTLAAVDALRAFTECQDRAITHTAASACRAQLESDLEDRMEEVLGRQVRPAG